MIMKTQHIQAIDGKPIYVRCWVDSDAQACGQLKGIIQVLHGIAEHSGRYHNLAKHLCQAGYVVVAHDHRGHGNTAQSLDELGRFDDYYGWRLVVSDTHAVNKDIRARFPNLPLIGIGHSMGGFILQTYAASYRDQIHAIALSAPTFTHPILARAGAVLAQIEKFRLGRRKASPIIQQLIFGNFNRPFSPARTQFDWLSRNPQAVDAYLSDEKCGFIGSTGLWQDLMEGVSDLYQPHTQAFLPTHIPFYVCAGGDDPVSNSAAGVKKLIGKLEEAGVSNLTVNIYPEARHEIFNEINQREVFRDLIRWADRCVQQFEQQKGPSDADADADAAVA